MAYLALIFLVAAALCLGAYRIGIRSDGWAMVLAPLLVLAAWHVLLDLLFTPGEGAAIGVAVSLALIWCVGLLCIVLALILLGAAYKARRSGLVAALALCVVLPAILVLGNRLRPKQPPAQTVGPPPATAPPRESYLEGYAWATDNGITTDTACTNGTPAFIAGCKSAVRRR